MKTQITVRGRRYTLRSDDGDVDLQAIALKVDSRMNEIAAKAGGLDEFSVAMLAAMNIASDYERFRLDVSAELDDLDRELASTSVMVEALLPNISIGDDAGAE
jgi:cell division protein ZapA (FtsZ GTPase activity inhibitor)